MILHPYVGCLVEVSECFSSQLLHLLIETKSTTTIVCSDFEHSQFVQNKSHFLSVCLTGLTLSRSAAWQTWLFRNVHSHMHSWHSRPWPAQQEHDAANKFESSAQELASAGGNVAHWQHQLHHQVPRCLTHLVWHIFSLLKNQSDGTVLHLSPPLPAPVITKVPDPHCKCTCHQCDSKARMCICFAFSSPCCSWVVVFTVALGEQSQRCSKTKGRRKASRRTHISRVFPR